MTARLLWALGAVALLAGCGTGTSGRTAVAIGADRATAGARAGTAVPAAPPVAAPALRAETTALPPSSPAPADDRHVLHLLSRITYGPRAEDVARVRAIGLAAYLEEQLRPERLDDTLVERTLKELPTLTMTIPDLLREYPQPDPALREKMQSGQMTREEMMERYPPEKRPFRIVADLQAARMARAVASERQLQEVMVDFWFNHLNVFAGKGEVRWYLTSYERDAIRPHALGRFRDLVRATARHPAMLFYLDNWLSVKPDFEIPAGSNKGRRAGLNENYARELMELHTLGVDGGYTQADVTEVARAFTGWTIGRSAAPGAQPRPDGRFVFRPVVHDPFPKTVLGHRIPGFGGQEDGERVIDILTRHPSTARFIATKLVRRFVADTPPEPLVTRVAATFQQTDGDIRGMLRVILTAPEFYAEDAYRAKIKKPSEFVASAARALGARVDARGAVALARAAAEIGEPLYEAQPPTGHPDRAEAWVNTGALLARLNFALALASGRYPGVRIELEPVARGADPARPAAVLEHLLATILHGQAGADTKRVLAAQIGDPQITRLTADDRGAARTDVEKLAALVLGAPEFQRR